jgi:hypothetical protein
MPPTRPTPAYVFRRVHFLLDASHLRGYDARRRQPWSRIDGVGGVGRCSAACWMRGYRVNLPRMGGTSGAGEGVGDDIRLARRKGCITCLLRRKIARDVARRRGMDQYLPVADGECASDPDGGLRKVEPGACMRSDVVGWSRPTPPMSPPRRGDGCEAAAPNPRRIHDESGRAM